MAYLITTDDTVAEKRIAIQDFPLTIGRHPDCEVVVEENSVSRRHAQITFEDGHFFISDLGSRNGTEVNGTLTRGKTRLFDGSEISICGIIFQFQLEEVASTASASKRVRPQSDEFRSSFFFVDDIERHSNIMSQVGLPAGDTLKDTAGDLRAKLKAISAVTLALTGVWERDEILQRILDTLFELFGESDRGFVVLVEPSGAITPHQMKSRRAQDMERVQISRTIVRQVLESRQAILSTDAASDARFDQSQSVVDFRIRSLMCAPLVDGAGQPIGAIQLDTLRSTVAFDQEDLEVLATVAMQASLALQKLELFKKVEESRQLEQDLRLAQEVQLRFLPQAEPHLPGYAFFSHYRPATHVGGDYFDYIRLGNHQWAIVVADVVGHGVAAALLMAKIAADSRYACALNPNPVKALEQINRSLNGLNLDRFVTLVLGYLDTEKSQLTVANAGHLPPLMRSATGDVRWIASARRSLPLGISDTAQFHAETVSLGPGDSVLLFTDGLSESSDTAGSQFGLERLAKEVELSPNGTPEAIGKAVCQAVKKHLGGSPPLDDICLVAFGRI